MLYRISTRIERELPNNEWKIEEGEREVRAVSRKHAIDKTLRFLNETYAPLSTIIHPGCRVYCSVGDPIPLANLMLCPKCRGDGRQRNFGPHRSTWDYVECSRCGGRGKVEDHRPQGFESRLAWKRHYDPNGRISK